MALIAQAYLSKFKTDTLLANEVSSVDHLRFDQYDTFFFGNTRYSDSSGRSRRAKCKECVYDGLGYHITYEEGTIRSIADRRGLVTRPPTRIQNYGLSVDHARITGLSAYDIAVVTAYDGRAMTTISDLTGVLELQMSGFGGSVRALFDDDPLRHRTQTHFERINTKMQKSHRTLDKRGISLLSVSQETRDDRFRQSWNDIFDLIRESCLDLIEDVFQLRLEGDGDEAPGLFKFQKTK